MFVWSAIAGGCAAAGSALGKLSGFAAAGGGAAAWALSTALLLAMMAVNTCGCRYYVRALDAADSSVVPTVVSSAVTYLLSGVSGVVLFGEPSSVRWWLGAALVSLGLALLSPSSARRDHSA